MLNEVIREAGRRGEGLGEALGRHLDTPRFPNRRLSIVAAGHRLGVPVTVHVAVGTDIIHMHPSADGAAIGATSLRDFHRLAEVVAGLSGGVYVNLGSAVVLPEVFVKALNLARNLGHRVRPLFTLDLDFLRHYRPGVNVVSRPTAAGGRGVHITGHHELLFPVLAGAVLERLASLGADAAYPSVARVGATGRARPTRPARGSSGGPARAAKSRRGKPGPAGARPR